VLRSKLARLGLGMVAPGVRITPAIRRTPRRSPAAARPDAYADLFHAHHLAFGDPAVTARPPGTGEPDHRLAEHGAADSRRAQGGRAEDQRPRLDPFRAGVPRTAHARWRPAAAR
jgi:hypothetical protein